MISERRSPVRILCAWLTALAVAWCSVTSQGRAFEIAADRAFDIAADHEHGLHHGLHHHHGHDHDSGGSGGNSHEDSATVVAHVHITGCLPTAAALPAREGKSVQETWDVSVIVPEIVAEFDRPPKRI